MKKINVEGGGFPGTSRTWRHIAEMIQQVADMAASVTGDNTIITGVNNVGGTISDGIVVIGGEIYPFEGGAAKTHVEIIEQIDQTQYLKDLNGDGTGDMIDTYFNRYARLTNTASGNIALQNFTRLQTQLELSKRSHPQTIEMYYGSINDIKKGWQLCDGTNGTPDLRGKFIVGYAPNDADYNSVGKSGGSKKHTLSKDEMPAHSHNGNTSFGGVHYHSFRNFYYVEAIRAPDLLDEFIGNNQRGSSGTDSDNRYVWYKHDNVVSGGGHSHSFNTNSAGGGKAHENRPPYFTLAYITYVG